MVGRNDPCPCGSGKKYKRCCIGKNEETASTLVADELERIIRGNYQKSRNRADMKKYEVFQKEWMNRLNAYWEENNINVAVTEYFLFVVQLQKWQEYIETTLQETLRDSVRSVVELWKEPVMLFGKVSQVENGVIEVKEIAGEEVFIVETDQEIEEGIVVFGLALRDNRQFENGLYTLTSFLFIKDVNQSFEKNVLQLMESDEEQSEVGFYQKHMLDIYEYMFNLDNTSVDDLIEDQLGDLQQEALMILDKALEEESVQDDMKEVLRNVGITYFLKEKPRFRKANVIAAAIFNVALEKKMLGELTMTNREVAERFDVSTSSITTHAERLQVFVENLVTNQEA